jgi:type I restriction enzyme M protein
VADEVTPSLKLIYDGACGTGGMLSVAEERLQQIAAERGKTVAVTLYGQEINAETWAICQADQLIKGEAAENIALDSTLSADHFPDKSFDFMISNPPYGTDWNADLAAMAGSKKKKEDIKDPRFIISFASDPEFSLLTRSSDSQLMFLANNLAKMREDTLQGSRIAEIHNGSSLFTGDAGSGESNVRRYVIENDWLEAIIALPLNLFYNTGIATYIWVVSNRKEERRRGKVQLIDATSRSTPLRKNLGKRNVSISDEQIAAIVAEFMAFEETETSKIFPNEAFGYWKVAVERPLRLRVDIPERNPGLPDDVWGVVEATGHDASWPRTLESAFWDTFKHHAKRQAVKAPATLRKQLRALLCVVDEDADAVLKSSTHVPYATGTEGDPLHGQFLTPIANHHYINEYEADPALRDTEQIALLEPGGIAGFMAREVLPHVPDAWITPGSEKIGYEINFNRHFYKPQAMRTLAEIEADILALERETDGLLGEILVGAEA